MEIDKLLNGISRSGSDGNYKYELLDSTSSEKPVNYVNFLDAVRFANWMHNGQGDVSTESGAYAITTAKLLGATRRNQITTYKAEGSLNLRVGDQAQMSGLKGSGFEARSTITSVYEKRGNTYFTIENEYPNEKARGTGFLTVLPATHEPDARYWIPTENEWYKAAYYNPTLNGGSGGYYNWATQSDSTPGNTIGDSSNQANIRTSTRFTNSEFLPKPDPLIGPHLLTAVGSFTNSGSYYGTFDQDGNVTEWNESIYDPSAVFGQYNASGNGTRSKRGASFYNPKAGSAHRDDGLMTNDGGYAAGFRLASGNSQASAAASAPSGTRGSSGSQASSSGQSSSSAQSSSSKNKSLVYTGVLSSANEVWPTITPATGTIKLTLNAKRTKATYELNVIGLDFGKWFDGQPRTADTGDDVAGMHFHHAPFYTVGDPCIGLINPNQDKDLKISYNKKTTAWTLKGTWTDKDPSVVSLSDSLQYIYDGELYTNIHTERVALGEIRAQFNPPPSSSGSQLLTALAPYSKSTTSGHVDHCCETSQAHIHTSVSGEDLCCETSDAKIHTSSSCTDLLSHTKIHTSDSGRDLLTGLKGSDAFTYDNMNDSPSSISRRDRIKNFNSSEDLIDLRALDADVSRDGHQSFTWIGDKSFTQSSPGQLRYHHGVVSADMNGDSRADFAISLIGSPILSSDNFLL